MKGFRLETVRETSILEPDVTHGLVIKASALEYIAEWLQDEVRRNCADAYHDEDRDTTPCITPAMIVEAIEAYEGGAGSLESMMMSPTDAELNAEAKCVLCACDAVEMKFGFPVCEYHQTHGEDDPPCPHHDHYDSKLEREAGSLGSMMMSPTDAELDEEAKDHHRDEFRDDDGLRASFYSASVEKLRADGCCVVIFTPEELQGRDADKVSASLVDLGWDVIHALDNEEDEV